MEKLPPIPTPGHQRWREFCIQVVPVIVFVLTLLVIAYLWRSYVQPTGLIGQVETNSAVIISTTEGLITDLAIERFDTVVKGQPIGHVEIIDPALHQASLAVISADLKLMKSRMDLDKTRNLDSYSRLRMDLLSEKVALGIAQARLKHAEAEFQRAEKLYKDRLITAGLPDIASGGDFDAGRFSFGYDVAVRDRDMIQAEVREREIIIRQLDQDIKQMEASGTVGITPTDPVIEETIRAQQEQLRLIEKPTVLKAPADGVVTTINRRAGEKVVRGDLIAVITPPVPTRIVGYLRQPLGEMPTTNDTVIVRSRSSRRQAAAAPILRVGAQMEIINPALISSANNVFELGLPILVKIPEGLQLVPGEIVDLSIQYAKR